MKTIAYMKADPDIEEIREQKKAILEFAKREQMPISRFIEVSISCVEVTKAKKINPLLNHIESGDTLIVTHLSQIGRSLSEVVKTVDWLVKKGIRFVALTENIDLNGKSSTQSQAVATIFGALAEIERERVSKPTQEALTIAKRTGRRGGRPPALNTEQHQSAIKLYHEGKHSIKEICQIMGISRATFYRYLDKANSKLKVTHPCGRDDINRKSIPS